MPTDALLVAFNLTAEIAFAMLAVGIPPHLGFQVLILELVLGKPGLVSLMLLAPLDEALQHRVLAELLL